VRVPAFAYWLLFLAGSACHDPRGVPEASASAVADSPNPKEDPEATEAVAVIRALGPPALEAEKYEAFWSHCHDQKPGYDDTLSCLRAAREHVTTITAALPKAEVKTACGLEIAKTYETYFNDELEHLHDEEAWMVKEEKRLRPVLMRGSLAERCPKGSCDPNASPPGYFKINTIACTKRVFRCDNDVNLTAPMICILAHLVAGAGHPSGKLLSRATGREY
jgi:hypothetical protein